MNQIGGRGRAGGGIDNHTPNISKRARDTEVHKGPRKSHADTPLGHTPPSDGRPPSAGAPPLLGQDSTCRGGGKGWGQRREQSCLTGFGAQLGRPGWWGQPPSPHQDRLLRPMAPWGGSDQQKDGGVAKVGWGNDKGRRIKLQEIRGTGCGQPAASSPPSLPSLLNIFLTSCLGPAGPGAGRPRLLPLWGQRTKARGRRGRTPHPLQWGHGRRKEFHPGWFLPLTTLTKKI